MPARVRALILLTLFAMATPAWARAQELAIALVPSPSNPSTAKMGDHLSFHSVIRNTSHKTLEGLIAWISLVRVDSGHEQPMDLEDWSAHKAVTRARLAPGQGIETDWPMRLIQAGRYRVVISATGREAKTLAVSPFATFDVRPKPVVESARILPVALGVPAALGLFLAWRLWKRRARA